MPTAPVHVTMSAGHPGQLLDLGEAARALPGHVGPVVTVAGVMLRDWTVYLNPLLPTGTIHVHPARLTIGVREYGDLELALLIAEHRRQAARFLRTTVVRVALESGLTDLRPFARPVGAP